MRKKILVIFFILCALFLLYHCLKYNVSHPVMRLSIDEISNIQLNKATYREFIRIQDGDTEYCYMEYKNKSDIAYSHELVKLIKSRIK